MPQFASMLMLLSPAKALDFDTPTPSELALRTPQFQAEAAKLIAQLKKLSASEIATLMSLSEKLSTLNVARYAAWKAKPAPDATRAAILAFDGDVYAGLDAKSLGSAELRWLDEHVGILSGLYGLLRPLDAMQPYRLEMGTQLATAQGQNLYQWWGGRVTEAVNAALQAEGHEQVVNLASQEYAKVLQAKDLCRPVVECVFQDWSGGHYKVVGLFAKRARGMMVRWAMKNQAHSAADLQDFDAEGYRFAPKLSTTDKMVFQRKRQA